MVDVCLGAVVGTRSINSVDIICQYAIECGMSLEAVLAGSFVQVKQGTHGAELTDEWVEEAQELTVLNNLLSYCGNGFSVGWQLGQRYQLTSYGIWGYAMLSSASLRKAIDLGLRYLGLTYALCDISSHEQDDQVWLSFSPKADGELGNLVLVRDLSALLVIKKELFADDFPEFKIELALPSQSLPQQTLSLLEYMGITVHFACEQNRVVFDKSVLDKPLPKANAQTAQLCEQQCCQLLQQQNSLKGLAQEVRDRLLSLGLGASMEDVAADMARTTRTLHRQLREEGTQWRQIRDYARMGMAEALLLNQMSLDEIAERLGYSDTANFSHAFKRWKGVGPRQYRQKHQFASRRL